MSQHIITFNVGGKHYDVSRSLLEKYPNTVLAMAASVIDDDDNNDPPELIFIERDGERFRYILDYMRDKSVSLPDSISITAFVRDLDYLGFQNVPLDSIQMQSSGLGYLYIPKDLKYESGIQFHQILWGGLGNATRSTQHVRFDKSNCLVRNQEGEGRVFGKIGFTSGVHFWNIRILHGPCVFGVGIPDHVYAGPRNTNEWEKYAPAKTDDIYGILLNMNEKYYTEYRNGQRIKMNLLRYSGVHYPYALLWGFQSFVSCEIPSEKNLFHFPGEETR